MEATTNLSPLAVPSSKPLRASRVLLIAARILLGAVFFVFGLDGFLHLIPAPTTPIPEGALAFAMAMMKTGYLFQLVKGTEVLAGALLLTNRLVPLALVLLAPVLVNIVAFHAFLEPSGLAIPIVLVGLEIYLAWRYRDAYRAVLAARAPA
jgi:uncharacterized membrane protein YphA (DoxX/SURF4 family)